MAGAYIIVANTGRGKTTFVKNRLKNVNPKAVWLYDVNSEYGNYGQPYMQMETFLEKATKMSNAVIVFEEATIFFSTKSSSKEMREILVRKRHSNNTIFLVFHSLSSIPQFIYQLCNGIFLFNTLDSENKINQKFDDERLTNLFNKVQEKSKSNFHYYDYLQIN